jgi:transposase
MRRLTPADPQGRRLDGFCRARRKAVDQRTSQIAALKELLRVAYPVALEMFDELNSPMVLEFLSRWPDLDSLQRSRSHTLRRFFYKHNSRSETRIQARLKAIGQARPWPGQEGLETLQAMQIKQHIQMIKLLNQSIADYDHAIQEHTRDHPQRHLFESLPGAGRALAPRLLAAYLNTPNAGNPKHMQTLSGIAPIRVQSGDYTKTFMRRHCSKFLRQTLHEFAGASVQFSKWARAYFFHATRNKGMHPQAAKRALALKWIRILSACWRTQTPYHEQQYIQALRQRNSPLADLIT